MYAAPEDPILFAGSFSIRKCEAVEIIFAKKKLMSGGIGGPVINDMIGYADDIIFSYKPRQMVIFIGKTDLPHESGKPDSIFHRTRRFFFANK